MIGIISISDTIRDFGNATMTDLRNQGVDELVLVTGDNYRTAEKTAREVGISSYHGELLPEDKVTIIEKLREQYQMVAMV